MTRLTERQDLQGNRLYWALLGCSGLSGLNLAALNCVWLYWAVLGRSGLHRAVKECTRVRAVLGYTGLYCAVLGSSGLH